MKSGMRAKVLVVAVALPMGMLTAYAVADGPSIILGGGRLAAGLGGRRRPSGRRVNAAQRLILSVP